MEYKLMVSKSKKNTKQGAMFGLDARIALAIFAALSVITGAALYNAVQDARATAVISDLNEIGKAYDSYLLDTGSQVPINTTEVKLLNIKELVTSTMRGWKGPYLSYNAVSATYLTSRDYKQMHLFYRNGDDWGYSLNGTPNASIPP